MAERIELSFEGDSTDARTATDAIERALKDLERTVTRLIAEMHKTMLPKRAVAETVAGYKAIERSAHEAGEEVSKTNRKLTQTAIGPWAYSRMLEKRGFVPIGRVLGDDDVDVDVRGVYGRRTFPFVVPDAVTGAALGAAFGRMSRGGGGGDRIPDWRDLTFFDELFKGIAPGGLRPRTGAFTLGAMLSSALIGAATPAAAGVGAGLLTSLGPLTAMITTLTTALGGLGDAISGDRAEFEKLDATSQKFVLTVRGFIPVFDEVRANVREKLLPDLGEALDMALNQRTVDTVTRGLRDIAGAIGEAAKAWGDWIGSDDFAARTERIMQSTAGLTGTWSDTALALADSLLVLTDAAQPMLEWMSAGVRDGAEWINMWLRQAEASGELAAAFQETEDEIRIVLDFLDQLIQAAWDLGAVLKPLGESILTDLTALLEDLSDWLDRNRQEISEGLIGAYEGLKNVIRTLWPWLEGMLELLVGVVNAMGGWETAFTLVLSGALANAFFKLAGAVTAVVVGTGTAGMRGAGLARLTELVKTLAAIGTIALVVELDATKQDIALLALLGTYIGWRVGGLYGALAGTASGILLGTLTNVGDGGSGGGGGGGSRKGRGGGGGGVGGATITPTTIDDPGVYTIPPGHPGAGKVPTTVLPQGSLIKPGAAGYHEAPQGAFGGGALDVTYSPGAAVGAPADGVIVGVWLNPTQDFAAGFGGWNIYLRDTSGGLYFMTHIFRPTVRKGSKVKRGTIIGYVDKKVGGAYHVHIEYQAQGGTVTPPAASPNTGGTARGNPPAWEGTSTADLVGSAIAEQLERDDIPAKAQIAVRKRAINILTKSMASLDPDQKVAARELIRKWTKEIDEIAYDAIREGVEDADVTPSKRDDVAARRRAIKLLKRLIPDIEDADLRRQAKALINQYQDEIPRLLDEIPISDAARAKLGRSLASLTEGFKRLPKEVREAVREPLEDLRELWKELLPGGITPAERRRFQEAMRQYRQLVARELEQFRAELARKFETTARDMAQAFFEAFDDETRKYKTPTELLIERLEKERTEGNLQRRVDEARKALEEAMRPKPGDAQSAIEEITARYKLARQVEIAQLSILGGDTAVSSLMDDFLRELEGAMSAATETVDQQAVADAQRELEEALYDQRMYYLELQAEAEREAYEKQREELRKHLELQTQLWTAYLSAMIAAGKLGYADALMLFELFLDGLLDVDARGNIAPGPNAPTGNEPKYQGDFSNVPAVPGGSGSRTLIPMARGGIINKPVFLMGEAGAELVTPLPVNWRAMQAQALYGAAGIGGDGGGGAPVYVNISSNDELLGELLAKAINVQVSRSTSVISDRIGRMADRRAREGRN